MKSILRSFVMASAAFAVACSGATPASNDGGAIDEDAGTQPEPDGGANDAPAQEDAAAPKTGTFAFAGGQMLDAIDVDDPASPSSVGTLAGMPVQGIAARGNLLYASRTGAVDGGAGSELTVVDVSDAANPTVVGSAPLAKSAGLEGPVVLAGSTAFVGEVKSFETFDLTQPTAPAQAGSLAINGAVRGLAVSGTTALLAVDEGLGKGGALVIVDVSTPSSPTIVSSTEVGHNVWGLGLDGTDAYLVLAGGQFDASNENILVFDVSVAASPAQIGGLKASNAKGIFVSSGHAYIAASSLVIADVSDPASPKIVATAKGHYQLMGIASGPKPNMVTLAGGDSVNPLAGDGSVEIFDVSTPSAPVEIGAYLQIKANPDAALAISTVQ